MLVLKLQVLNHIVITRICAKNSLFLEFSSDFFFCKLRERYYHIRKLGCGEIKNKYNIYKRHKSSFIVM